jgi:hypothetical protein
MNWSIRVLIVSLSLLSLMCFATWAQEKSAPEGNGQTVQQPEAKKGGNNGNKNVASEEFGDAVVQRLLTQIRNGMEGHSSRVMMSAFDADKMEGYMTFEDQIQAMFDHYESFRVHYQIMQTSSDGARGAALVDFQMEETPMAADVAPLSKSNQIRFEFLQGKKGWKIVDFSPRGFFS